MLETLLLGAALACAAPACGPIEMGNGVYFPCNGGRFAEAWTSYFDTHPDQKMEGAIHVVYDDAGKLGYYMSTFTYVYEPTLTERIIDVVLGP
jgi:hypothetical protein